MVAVGAAGVTALGLARMGSMTDYNEAVAVSRAVLPDHPELRDLVRYATVAANGHNTQPWRFHVDEGRIAILPDFSRRTPVVDPDDHHLVAVQPSPGGVVTSSFRHRSAGDAGSGRKTTNMPDNYARRRELPS